MQKYRIEINIETKKPMKKIIQYFLNAFMDILNADCTVKNTKVSLTKIKSNKIKELRNEEKQNR